jgi:hypothetical protein
MEADDNPLVATVASILLSATVGNEIAKRGWVQKNVLKPLDK